MEYKNGFAREEFLQHMFREFPAVFNNFFSREMLENIVDYGKANHTVTKNGLFYYLKAMIPEVGYADLIPYIDRDLLTDEVLCFVENQELDQSYVAKYNKIVKCDLEGISSVDYYENCYLLTGDNVEVDEGLEVELTGEFYFNTEFKSLNREEVATVDSIDELVDFCKKHDISVPSECHSVECCLFVGGGRDYVLDNGLCALGWEEELNDISVDEKINDATERSVETDNDKNKDFEIVKE